MTCIGKSKNMKKIIIWTLILISVLVLLIRYSSKVGEVFLGIKQVSGISILSMPEGATVYLDGKEVGKTPYEDKNLPIKQVDVRVEKDGSSWQGKVNLTAQTITIINRDLAKETASSAGEVLTLEKGKGLTLVSNPSEAEIEIDGKSIGKSPITVNLDSGEHTIVVSHPNYLKRSIRASLPDKFNLTVSVDLSLSEADLTAVATEVITQTPQVKVLQTPTGFLRVRDKPSLSGKEISRVNTGDKMVFLESLSGWTRVKLSDGTEGFVSSSYIEKIPSGS